MHRTEFLEHGPSVPRVISLEAVHDRIQGRMCSIIFGAKIICTLFFGSLACVTTEPRPVEQQGAMPFPGTGPCGGNNFSGTCDELVQYAQRCGTICPDGVPKFGAYGCTSWEVAPSGVTVVPIGTPTESNGQWCVQGLGNHSITINTLSSAKLNWSINREPCCSDACLEEIELFSAAVEQHEDEHRSHIQTVVHGYNQKWRGHLVAACHPDRSKLAEALYIETRSLVNADYNAALRQIEWEPAFLPPRCDACVVRTDNSICLNCPGAASPQCVTEGATCCGPPGGPRYICPPGHRCVHYPGDGTYRDCPMEEGKTCVCVPADALP